MKVGARWRELLQGCENDYALLSFSGNVNKPPIVIVDVKPQTFKPIWKAQK
jgi:hypothetical protein